MAKVEELTAPQRALVERLTVRKATEYEAGMLDALKVSTVCEVDQKAITAALAHQQEAAK